MTMAQNIRTMPSHGANWDGYGADMDAAVRELQAQVAALQSVASGTAPATAQARLTLGTGGVVKRNGTTYRTGGANAFQLVHNDYPSSRLMSHSEIDSLLDKAVTLKAGIVRAHTLGVNVGSSSNHLVTGVTGTTTPVISYNTAVWEVMDYAVAAAASRGLYLMVPMVDELHYYHGGKATWVNFRRPGTVSLDGNVKSSSSSTQRAAEDYFYTDSQIRTDFKKYISDWLNHVNQYTGLAYKDTPAIAIVETGNELWTADSFRTWTPEIAAYIKSIAPNVLVADGMAADGSSYWAAQNPAQDPIGHIVTTESLASTSIDVVGIHPYSVFTAADVTTAASRAASAGKAFLVGEYPWSKTAAPGIESAARGAANCVATAFWSLQNDADLHNNGAGYGIDDAALYVPGKDSTQTAAVARLQAHSTSLGQ
jgi:mannan endo-1,4-beta-mannosidase